MGNSGEDLDAPVVNVGDVLDVFLDLGEDRQAGGYQANEQES